MNHADALDYHLAQMAALSLTAAQYIALHPEIDREVRTLLLLTQQLRPIARPTPSLSAEARARIFERVTHGSPPPPAPPRTESKSAGFFVPGFHRQEVLRYIGAQGLELLWRIHKAPSGCATAIFDAVVLLMRALRRLEMYNSFR